MGELNGLVETSGERVCVEWGWREESRGPAWWGGFWNFFKNGVIYHLDIKNGVQVIQFSEMVITWFKTTDCWFGFIRAYKPWLEITVWAKNIPIRSSDPRFALFKFNLIQTVVANHVLVEFVFWIPQTVVWDNGKGQELCKPWSWTTGCQDALFSLYYSREFNGEKSKTY
jgi:hypothetical protein